jgi:hypothetical protein
MSSEKTFQLGNHIYKGDREKYPPFWLEGIEDTPQVLYKNFSLSQTSLNSLKTNRLWGSHPFQFNDPFDFHENLVEIDSPELVRKFFENIGVNYEEERKKFSSDEDITEYVKRHFTQMIYRKLGVISMSSNPNNLLMWSYYGNNQGFQVGYFWEKFNFKYLGPYPVNYVEEVTRLSVKEYDIPLTTLYQSNVKFKGWEHEKEWRFLIDKGGDMKSYGLCELEGLDGMDRLVEFPVECVKNVSLGNRFFRNCEIKVMDKNLSLEMKPRFDDEGKMWDIDELRIELMEHLSERGIQVNICQYYDVEKFELKFSRGRLSKTDDLKFFYQPVDEDF